VKGRLQRCLLYISAAAKFRLGDTTMVERIPKPTTSNAKAEGRFDKADFIFIAKDDEYRYPAGERAIYPFTREEAGLQIRRYWSSACPQCAMKAKCTPSDNRRISRWEHEHVLESVQNRMDHTPNAMSIRRRTVEHVFGTLNSRMVTKQIQSRILFLYGLCPNPPFNRPERRQSKAEKQSATAIAKLVKK
jgi:hypothetical protein